MLEIKSLEGQYAGATCVMVGTGRGLLEAPLGRLDREVFTFGFNRVSKVFGKTLWRPDFFVDFDESFDRWFFKGHQAARLTFTDWDNLNHYGERDDVCVVNVEKRSVGSLIHDNWMLDANKGVVGCGVGLLPALQIADWMGFSRIGLLGFDKIEEDDPVESWVDRDYENWEMWTIMRYAKENLVAPEFYDCSLYGFDTVIGVTLLNFLKI